MKKIYRMGACITTKERDIEEGELRREIKVRSKRTANYDCWGGVISFEEGEIYDGVVFDADTSIYNGDIGMKTRSYLIGQDFEVLKD